MPEGLDKLAGAVGEAIKTVPSLYDDALKPTVVELGKTVALLPRAINAALSPIEKFIANKEYNVAETKKLLAIKLENVNEEKIVPPDAYVAVPAMQAISYCMDNDELRNLYANLLANSMNIDTKDNVHPAFIETIKQLSPSDAKYFKKIAPLQKRPMITTNLIVDKKGNWIVLVSNYNKFSDGFETNLSVILNNLCRLGLIEIPPTTHYADEDIYSDLMNDFKDTPIEQFKPMFPEAQQIDYRKHNIDMTDYGTLFYNICVKD